MIPMTTTTTYVGHPWQILVMLDYKCKPHIILLGSGINVSFIDMIEAKLPEWFKHHMGDFHAGQIFMISIKLFSDNGVDMTTCLRDPVDEKKSCHIQKTRFDLVSHICFSTY